MEGFPCRGFIFWPVGTGDSITIVVDQKNGIILQVDLRHMECANDTEDPHAPIIDLLKEQLPKVKGKPYLPVFVLTHPDMDHCQGFARLLKEVMIGELWFSPRIFREYQKDLCDDASVFKKEAERRVQKMIENKGIVGSGDRVHLIGYDELLKEEEFEGFPRDQFTVPGNTITELDGIDYADRFRAFVHAPFKDDSEGERNDTSIALQVALFDGEFFGSALLLGDHCYPTVKRIFDCTTEKSNLLWNVFLTPHHCSKKVMYWRNEGEEEEFLKRDVLEAINSSVSDPGYIVASSEPIPPTNEPGDNPPHAKAKNRYAEIAPNGFLCTHEHGSKEHPLPIVFELTDKGLIYWEPQISAITELTALAKAVDHARGGAEPPSDRVGFGREK
jgi:hypothetical protein